MRSIYPLHRSFTNSQRKPIILRPLKKIKTRFNCWLDAYKEDVFKPKVLNEIKSIKNKCS